MRLLYSTSLRQVCRPVGVLLCDVDLEAEFVNRLGHERVVELLMSS